MIKKKEESREPPSYFIAVAVREDRASEAVLLPLAELAENQDEDVSREEIYNYANYFDNKSEIKKSRHGGQTAINK